ncbi:sulfur carrier protein ThiS [Arsenicicoccus dermatophilus]|uniref:sulfur carrier protein ThiS n=1 Tax=Arsenicicoccus dermatophilus TaxID=1076331 RepID=UPI001F4D0B1E|nr:sulfur carrier protein ThiS [Arsenicicoccus dermatophilus]MCH8612029.1 sulfur carrier protein ThiS [Arsenicicoccus dermatophilus]
MTVTVNGEPREVPEGCDVAALVAALGLSPDGIAVAVDQAVVPRARWSGRTLEAGTRVEVVTAMQGG